MALFRVALLGDLQLGRLVDSVLASGRTSTTSVLGDVSTLAHADTVIANLECALAPPTTPFTHIPKAFYFRSTPRLGAAVLTSARVAAVSLANNHALDCGEVGLDRTLATLAAAGIACAGAGRTLAAARSPALWTAPSAAGPITCALLAFADSGNAGDGAWEAAPRSAGVASGEPGDPSLTAWVDAGVAAARAKGAQLVVVAPHWGGNYPPGRRPPGQHVAFARALVGRPGGPDILFGTSSHVPLPFEVIARGDGTAALVVYGAGDCVDDYAVDPGDRNDLSFVWEAAFARTGGGGLTLVGVVLTPVKLTVARTTPLRRGEADWDWVTRRMLAGCAGCGVELTVEGDALVGVV